MTPTQAASPAYSKPHLSEVHILCGRQPKAPLGTLMGQQSCGQLVGHLDITAKVASCVLCGVAQKQGKPLGAS